MPTPNERPSLSKDLLTRYSTQRAGGAFDVKDVLKNPGNTPLAGTVIDAASVKGATFQTPNGFKVKADQGGVSQLKDAQGNTSHLSTYIKGFDGRRYHR